MNSVRQVKGSAQGSLAEAAFVSLGALKLVALSDGYIELPLTAFDGPDIQRFGSFLEAAGVSGPPIRTSVSTFLVEDEGRKILVDTGMGQLAGPTMGHLVESLALASVKPGDITDIILTHLHRDHCGGLMDANGARVFENAAVHVNGDEFRYWTSDSQAERAPDRLKRFFDAAQRAMRACEGQVKLMEGAVQVTRRVRVQPMVGHTPGHSGIWFEDGDDAVCMWGDIVHCAALQITAPRTTVAFDSDPSQAATTRIGVLRSAAGRRCWVAGAHVPFPGIGRIEQMQAESFRLVALA